MRSGFRSAKRTLLTPTAFMYPVKITFMLALLGSLFLAACSSVPHSDSAVSSAGPRATISLEGAWRFSSKDDPASAQPGFDDSAWETVQVPHTWNAADGQDGGNDYRRGAGWYRKTFRADASLSGKRIYIQFDGVSQLADVYLNGRKLGTHKGAFARFRFDATEALRPGQDNLLAVRADNGRGLHLLPYYSDFTIFGGIYRPVSLLVTDPVQISATDHASAGVYLTQRNVDASRADFDCASLVRNGDPVPRDIEVRAMLSTAAGQPIASKTDRVPLAPGAEQRLVQPFTLGNPRLWDGLKDPYLYKVTVSLYVDGKLRDRVEQNLGLRFFKVDPNEGFFLNGRHLKLHGISRHQDRLNKGWAIGPEDEAEDFAFVREIGANAVRGAHYEHTDSWYSRCDEAGMVVWAEIAFLGKAETDPAFLENARLELTELIRQNYNHPSICFWGLGNETRDDAALSVLENLDALQKSEDPTRLSTYASDHPVEDPRNFVTDLIAYNRYYGWYGDDGFGKLQDFVDDFHRGHPKSCLGISEYGAGASILHQEQNPGKPKHDGAFHPEQYQALLHETAWPIVRDTKHLWGGFVWNLFDFASDFRREGDRPGRNDKGLVTYDRKVRKDAFYYYKANWTEAPVLVITSGRHQRRSSGSTEVKIYSNAKTVELFINNQSLGIRSGKDCVFRWPGIRLDPGANRVVARASVGGQLLKDECLWILEDAARQGR